MESNTTTAPISSSAGSSVSREEVLEFLNLACRNWPRMPRLQEDDIGDIATALLWFVGKRLTPPSANSGPHPEGQAGPLMKRVTIDGQDVLLPSDAKLAESFPADGTPEEQQAWLEENDKQPLGGTW